MKKTVEITANFTGTIPKASYENEKPFYGFKETIQLDEGEIMTDAELISRQKQLHDYCYKQFRLQAEMANIERIQKEYQNIRFYDCGDGRKYPSVTSILNWDADFSIPADELAQYASRGSIIHKQV